MDFSLTEAQQAIAGLAAEILADHGGHERAVEIEQAGGIDLVAWKALGSSGLLDAVTGEDGGVLAAAQLAIEVGRNVVTLPAWALLGGLLSLPTEDRPASVLDGSELVTLGLHEFGVPEVRRLHTTATEAGALTGSKPNVPALEATAKVLVAASGHASSRLYLVDLPRPGAAIEVVRTTDRGSAGHLTLDAVPGVRVGDEDTLVRSEQIATVLVCATLIGLGEQATARAATYVSERHQFGRPIASFQGPLLRLADAHIDLEAMRVTLLRAAWCLDTARPAAAAVAVAKWWAAEGAHRIISTAQHLHGGIGADVSYPAHRYFIRGKQLIDTMGGAAVQAARLGDVLAEGVGA